MKYLSFILFVVVALMSCNKDEETSIINNDDDNLIGTWSLNENYKRYVNDSLQFQGVSDYTLGIKDGVMTISFLVRERAKKNIPKKEYDYTLLKITFALWKNYQVA